MSTKTQSPASRATRASLAGAVVAALAASACCIGPAILAVVGLSGAGFAAALAPYRPVFLGATVLLLGLGFYLTYRKPKLATAGAGATGDGDACGCEMPRAARSGRVMLWIATLLVAGFASYPYVAGAFATRAAPGASAPVVNQATARVRVEGMTCEGCTTHITGDLAKVKGVIRAEVSYQQGLAVVTYDPAQVGPERFVDVVSRLGYAARLEN